MSAETPTGARRRWRFRVIERVIEWLLYRLVAMAYADRDLHELRHIDAQFKAGESVRCGPGCPLRETPAPSAETTRER